MLLLSLGLEILLKPGTLFNDMSSKLFTAN